MKSLIFLFPYFSSSLLRPSFQIKQVVTKQMERNELKTSILNSKYN